ncbi:hypothetical protein R3I93_002630 [Phoxinus phoxinus]|uniref:Uncharacterized protein n=1 Tax=Phoxinus phoxinus TaxID=58324 RepID=A0AAN9DI94_9TELE
MLKEGGGHGKRIKRDIRLVVGLCSPRISDSVVLRLPQRMGSVFMIGGKGVMAEERLHRVQTDHVSTMLLLLYKST